MAAGRKSTMQPPSRCRGGRGTTREQGRNNTTSTARAHPGTGPARPPANRFQLSETKYSQAHQAPARTANTSSAQRSGTAATQSAQQALMTGSARGTKPVKKPKAVKPAVASKPSEAPSSTDVFDLVRKIDADRAAAEAERMARSSTVVGHGQSGDAGRTSDPVRSNRGNSTAQDVQKSGPDDTSTSEATAHSKKRARASSEVSSRPEERQVHLSNPTDVCNLLTLLDQERKIVDANDGRRSRRGFRRPKTIRYDRYDEQVDAEIKKLEKQKQILETFAGRKSLAKERNNPQDLVLEKTTSALPFSTPVEIGPKYTTLRLSTALKEEIRSVFRSKFDDDDEASATAYCLKWLLNQIEDLETSPVHYDSEAIRGEQKSMFLKDVVNFKDELFEVLKEMLPSAKLPESTSDDYFLSIFGQSAAQRNKTSIKDATASSASATDPSEASSANADGPSTPKGQRSNSDTGANKVSSTTDAGDDKGAEDDDDRKWSPNSPSYSPTSEYDDAPSPSPSPGPTSRDHPTTPDRTPSPSPYSPPDSPFLPPDSPGSE